MAYGNEERIGCMSAEALDEAGLVRCTFCNHEIEKLDAERIDGDAACGECASVLVSCCRCSRLAARNELDEGRCIECTPSAAAVAMDEMLAVLP